MVLRPLAEATPMAVPASFNDLAKAIRELITRDKNHPGVVL